MQVINQYNISKLDIINAKTSQSFQDMTDIVEIEKAAIVQSKDNDGNECEYAYVFGADGSVWGGTSATVRETIDELIDLMNDEPDHRYAMRITTGKSKSGRDFLNARISEVQK